MQNKISPTEVALLRAVRQIPNYADAQQRRNAMKEGNCYVAYDRLQLGIDLSSTGDCV